jgi:hypothetical protein
MPGTDFRGRTGRRHGRSDVIHRSSVYKNSQALSAEPESALGYRACHHRDNRILDLPRLPCAKDWDCSQL